MSHVVLPASTDNASEAGVNGRLQFNGPLTICLMSGPWPPSQSVQGLCNLEGGTWAGYFSNIAQ